MDIESLRQEMHELMENDQYVVSDAVIIKSQELDELLVKYCDMKNNLK